MPVENLYPLAEASGNRIPYRPPHAAISRRPGPLAGCSHLEEQLHDAS
jgi:hypothetical protein